jgi:hypothetical protein
MGIPARFNVQPLMCGEESLPDVKPRSCCSASSRDHMGHGCTKLANFRLDLVTNGTSHALRLVNTHSGVCHCA